MKEFILDFYGYVIFFYSLGLIIFYVLHMRLSRWVIMKNKKSIISSYAKNIIQDSPYTPGVSIVAPAYNEEKTIVDNVNSLLSQDYPIFEVVIVNDGSKDKTLEKLISQFNMVEVPYQYIERIPTRPFKRLFMSENEAYSKLIVVDKENGGTKADAVNAGLNVANYEYFINTDVDCILSRDAILQCMLPVLRSANVIAVSGIMAISNGCKVENGQITDAAPPRTPIPLFQSLEYMRSFLIGKMGWTALNGMPNVSGGYGLFNRDICIEAGGYSHDSFAEDMDVLWRMITYCCDYKLKYKVVQIPHTCCWTEGPPNVMILSRQRTRWGRGLLQTFARHKKMIFNPKYKQHGLLTIPYMLIFELLAPVIEMIGLFALIYLAFTGGVNWNTAIFIFGAVFTFNILVSFAVMLYDWLIGCSFKHMGSYARLMFASIFEPFIYHPLIVFFSLTCYFNYIINKKAKWGTMTRQGFGQNKNEKEGELGKQPS